MGMTILAIPFLIFGIFIKPYSLEASRCFSVSFAGKSTYCFEQNSNLPEVIKYGSVALGFALIYAGRLQIRRRRGQD